MEIGNHSGRLINDDPFINSFQTRKTYVILKLHNICNNKYMFNQTNIYFIINP